MIYPIIEILKKSNAKRILDLGCGNGSLVKILFDEGFEIVGIEPSESGIKNCRKLLPDSKFQCMNIYDNPEILTDKNFDAVVSTEVIEHLFYPRELIKFASLKLKTNCSLIITTPYHGYIKNLMLSVFNKWDFHHNPLWDGGHIKFWSKKTLSHLLREQNFKIDKFYGCGRLPFLWKSLLVHAKK